MNRTIFSIFLSLMLLLSTTNIYLSFKVNASGKTFCIEKNSWDKIFGGSSYDEGYSVEQTVDGGYVITGATLSFGSGNWDVWLIKTDPNGDEEWNSTFGGSGYDKGNSVKQTEDGGYIISGCTHSFGEGEFDVWMIKTDSNGDEEWNSTFGGPNVDWGCSVDLTFDGGYMIAGYTESFGAGGSDFWLIKTDSSGNEEWSSTFGGGNHDRGFSGQQTDEGGYVLAGYTVSYDSDGTGCDVWLVKTDTNGDEEWTETFGGSGIPNKFDMAYDVQQTNDGGYIITGDTEIYYVSKSDVLLIKTDSSGNEEWTETFGGTDTDRGRSVQQTIDGGYIITGWAVSFGTPDPDIWLIKTDSNGDEQWNEIYGYEEESGDWGYSVEQAQDGGFILVGATMTIGWIKNKLDFLEDEDEGTDVWLIKTPMADNIPPIADFTFIPSHPNVDETITFNDSSFDPDGTIISWYWDFDDGNISYDQNPTHKYRSSGEYMVCLNVTDNKGLTDAVTKLVPVDFDLISICDMSKGWNFVSIPLNYSVDKTDLFVKYDGYYYNWTQATDSDNGVILNPYVLGWDRIGQYYIFSDILEPGYGFWIYSYEYCVILFENLTFPPGDSYITQMSIGWNIVGLPFDENVTKSELLVNDVYWLDALSLGLVSDFIFGWNRAGQYYNFADTLIPGYAYWVYAYQPTTLKRTN